jgi:hypothetical protein
MASLSKTPDPIRTDDQITAYGTARSTVLTEAQLSADEL